MSLPSHPFISIIIPHWNGVEILSECIDSLKNSTYPNFEIIVVDNASTDESVAWLKEHHPGILLVQNEVNLGYAGGCNAGVHYAKGEYVLFLNNDTCVESGWIEPLVEQIISNPKTAAVQPKILNYYQKDLFDYAGGSGGHLDLFCFPFTKGRIFLEQEIDHGQYDTSERIFWSSGTAFLTKKELFQEAGEFDKSFFAHMEEIDLCWRYQLMGYEIWAEPKSVIYHKNAVTLPMYTYKKYYLNHKNSLVMLLSNYSLPVSVYLFPLRFVLEWIAFFYALIKLDYKHMTAIINAQIWLIFHPHIVLRKRIENSKIRVKKDRQIMSNLFKGSIVFMYYLKRTRRYSDISSSPSE